MQYLLHGIIHWDYFLWFFCAGLLSALVGQLAVGYLVKKYNKASIIVFSLAFLVLVSLFLMTGVGVYKTIVNIQKGVYQGFKSPC